MKRDSRTPVRLDILSIVRIYEYTHIAHSYFYTALYFTLMSFVWQSFVHEFKRFTFYGYLVSRVDLLLYLFPSIFLFLHRFVIEQWNVVLLWWDCHRVKYCFFTRDNNRPYRYLGMFICRDELWCHFWSCHKPF